MGEEGCFLVYTVASFYTTRMDDDKDIRTFPSQLYDPQTILRQGPMEGRKRGRGMQPLDEIEVGGAISAQAIRQEALRVAQNVPSMAGRGCGTPGG